MPRVHAELTPLESTAETAELARVRRERIGWGDLGRIGLTSVAAPVFGPHDIQAAMAVIGTSAVLPHDDRNTEGVRLLRESADKLSSLLAP